MRTNLSSYIYREFCRILLHLPNKCTIYVNNYLLFIALLHASMFVRNSQGVSYYVQQTYKITKMETAIEVVKMYKCINVFISLRRILYINPYPTAFPYGNGMVLHFYQQQESSTTKTVHNVINKGLKAYV